MLQENEFNSNVDIQMHTSTYCKTVVLWRSDGNLFVFVLNSAFKNLPDALKVLFTK
jgi:hypothetical protein